eukprot:80710-Pyramimonas_sp.AAC.1
MAEIDGGGGDNKFEIAPARALDDHQPSNSLSTIADQRREMQLERECATAERRTYDDEIVAWCNGDGK